MTGVRHDLERHPMRRPVNPYRVLAHAIDVGDQPLAALLAARLAKPGSRRARAAGRVVERLIRTLGLN
jgi:hypothetical protein